MIKVGFIGAGNMGSALMNAAAQLAEVKISVFDTDEKKAKLIADKIGGVYQTSKKNRRRMRLYLPCGEAKYNTCRRKGFSARA